MESLAFQDFLPGSALPEMGNRRGEARLVRRLIDELPQEIVRPLDTSLLEDLQNLVAG